MSRTRTFEWWLLLVYLGSSAHCMVYTKLPRINRCRPHEHASASTQSRAYFEILDSVYYFSLIITGHYYGYCVYGYYFPNGKRFRNVLLHFPLKTSDEWISYLVNLVTISVSIDLLLYNSNKIPRAYRVLVENIE